MTLAPGSLWLDAQGAQNRAHFDRGIPRYIAEHVRAIAAAAPAAVAAVGLNETQPLTGNLDWLLGSGRLQWAGPGLPAPARLPRVYHVMSPMELGRGVDEIWPRWARTPATKLVVTVYDLIPLLFPDPYLADLSVRTGYMARLELVRHAHHVLAISQTTADDVAVRLQVARERITVIDAGVSSGFLEPPVAAREAARPTSARFPQLRPGFMLYVAGIDFRKNVERLIEAHALTSERFRAEHQLVVVCRMTDHQRRLLLALAARTGLRDDDLILTGFVSDAELAELYRGCRLFVFASFYEGSGLPMLEAMASGVPIAASNTSTSPEVLGDVEATFDPFDVHDIARVLQQTLADPALLERLRERSRRRVAAYTWEHVARRSIHAYERVLTAPKGRPGARRHRPRIALFTPWPQDRSGIAGYNRRLVHHLGSSVDVDVVVGGPRDGYGTPAEPGTRVVHADDFDCVQRLRGYDRIVYCMGNSHFHGYIYEALRLRPGIVVAHDVRLSGFYGWYSGQERPVDPGGRLLERIAAMYGQRVGDFAGIPPSAAQQAALGIYMTHEIQEYAEQIAVHSDYAADILRMDRWSHGRAAPAVTVIPLAYPDRPQPLDDAPRSGQTIVSFGIMDEVKNPQVLIAAFALAADERPAARLVFAGGGADADVERWTQLAAGLGVADRVSFPGHVPDAEWDRLLEEAAVAVQLRSVSNGEASAAAADCLASGLPLIVSEQGWFAELPDDAVVKVPTGVTARRLAAVIGRILDAPDEAHALTVAGRAHAAANSFAHVAERYLELLGL